MTKPKGKTPSLLSKSTGKPIAHISEKKNGCNRCNTPILMNEKCLRIPKTSAGFTQRPIYCVACFKDIIAQTKKELAEIEKLIS